MKMKFPILLLAGATVLAASPLGRHRDATLSTRTSQSISHTFKMMSFEQALRLAELDRQMAAEALAKTVQPSPAGHLSTMSATETEPQQETEAEAGTDHRGTTNPLSCHNPRTRVEWRNLAKEEKRSYVHAVRCLMDKPAPSNQIPASAGDSVYAQLAWVHVDMAPQVHNTDLFLPWHRYYMLVFEQLLRDHCDYRGPLVWWDETQDTGNFTGSGLFTDEYYGELPVVEDGDTEPCVTTGVGQCLSWQS